MAASAMPCASKAYTLKLKFLYAFCNTREKLIQMPLFRINRTLTTCSRCYSQRKKKQPMIDPRKNIQYPYVRGDPLHEDKIREINKKSDPLGKLSEKAKKSEEKKLKQIEESKSEQQIYAELTYEKLKEGDPRLGQAIIEAKSSKAGSTSTNIILEGQRLIKDALLLGATPRCLYFCETQILDDLPAHHLKGVPLYKILYKDMKTWSDTTTPSGILGLFKRPDQGEVISEPEVTLPITLIFDSLKDPGNAGTLIRTAAAIGCQRVITTKGSVNVWDTKVLRSAMGGHFSVPIYSGMSWSEVHNYIDKDTQVFLANSRPARVLSRSFDTKLSHEDVRSQETETEESDSESDTDVDDIELEKRKIRQEEHAEHMVYSFHRVPMMVYDYSEILINQPKSSDGDEGGSPTSVALVVGGETEGLSALAKQFAYNHYGQYVTIPMSMHVNSLNTGIAGSIILYELRRKLLMLSAEKKEPRSQNVCS
ncbi:unnamed protein product [Lymnaea stagnalis]|uniref:RNA 2-O ribose methyltransferase substrate binding domain-containing protein n=1 Tax=Lymnaea stagnalis TaxID=6523 RepID=A0AAV2HNP9_LYMST